MIFQAEQEYILENHAVLLRPLVLSDIEYLEPFAASEPELWRFSLISAADSGMESYINQAMRARNEGKEYAFIVFDKRQGNMQAVQDFMIFRHLLIMCSWVLHGMARIFKVLD